MTWLTPEDAIRVGIEVAVVDSSDRELRERLNPDAMKRIENSDILGHDLKRMPIRGLTAEECERECAVNSDCKAFTFNTRHSACFLKSNAAQLTPRLGLNLDTKQTLKEKY